MDKREQVLGSRAFWGQVGYTGEAHVPVAGTYPGIDANNLRWTTTHDSGKHPMPKDARAALANLVPLIMAALNEVGFAWEAGPLSTWSN